MTLPALAAKFNIPRSTIASQATAQGWSNGAAARAEAELRAQERAALVAPLDETKKAAFIEEETQRRAALLTQHRDEPKIVRERLYTGIKGHRAATNGADKKLAFQDLMAAKIASEVLLNLHRVERQAWGYESGMLLGDGSGSGAVCVEVIFVQPPTTPQPRLINPPETIDHESDTERQER